MRRKAGPWALQDAKARFSEIVRLACKKGPQRVTVHGKDAVVIVSAAEYDTLAIRSKYPSLSALLADSPLQDVDLSSSRSA